jgi:hypothetical protein
MFAKVRRYLFRPVSIPGWLTLGLFLFNEIPTWHSRIQFWSEAIVKYAPQLAGLFAFLLSSAGRWLVLLVSIVWIAMAALGKDSGKKPHFSYTDQSGGLYDLSDNLVGSYLIVKNDETRYQSTAHHVKATIRYKHHLGDELTVNGVWMTRNNTPRAYADQASLGMNEWQCLLLVIWPNWETKFYAPGTPIPPQLDPTRCLEFGRWTVEIKLKGDNIKNTYKGVLTLVANQGPTLTRF